MDRPKVQKWNRPSHINEYPQGPGFDAGHLSEKNAGWRNFRPVIDKEKCTDCQRCFLLCPDGTIIRTENKVEVDYDFCKGCGVCAYECKINAIEMVKEEV